MNDLIKALQIFSKYGDPRWPTFCKEDLLYVNINPRIVSQEDKNALVKLGFYPSNNDAIDIFYSSRFGSC